MTWSLVAIDPATGRIGVAVASRFFAVGARVPFIAPRAGAVATQALVNPLYGPKGLALLREGASAEETLRALLDVDAGRDARQAHVLDRAGRTAAHTGRDCVDWCGHVAGPGCSVAGNMLAGPEVVAETARAFEEGAPLPFPRRLIAAMAAGEAAGGDKRGRQSAALLVFGDEDASDLDIRVDDHPDPIPELARLEAVSRERWVHLRPFLPRRDDPVGVTDRDLINAAIERALAEEA